VTILCAAIGIAQHSSQQPPVSLIRNAEFEQWQWREFNDSQRKSIKALLKAGTRLEDLNLEIRGPLYRGLTGYGETSGVMLEGQDAFQGASLFLRADAQALAWGYHWLLLKGLEAGKVYTYDIALRGSGQLALRAWAGGKNVHTGASTWLGFPDLVKITPTADWQRYQGTLTMPNLGTPDCPQDAAHCALMLTPGSAIALDNFLLMAE
jgi:hypothetical protein